MSIFRASGGCVTRRSPRCGAGPRQARPKAFRHSFRRSEEHTSELQSLRHLVCRLLLEKNASEQPSPTAGPFTAAPPGFGLAGRRAPARRQYATRAANMKSEAKSSDQPFFFNDPATTEIYTLSLHDALPISAEDARTIAEKRRQEEQVASLQAE